MSPSTNDYLRHIRDEAQYLIEMSGQLDKDMFLEDPTLKRAFVRSLEIIGEAVKQIPTNVREQYPQIEWRAIGRMRDRLIHAYFGVDYEIVWDVVTTDVPILEKVATKLLEADSTE